MSRTARWLLVIPTQHFTNDKTCHHRSQRKSGAQQLIVGEKAQCFHACRPAKQEAHEALCACMHAGRVDDLWSWFYMCVELWEGRLPWRRDLSHAGGALVKPAPCCCQDFWCCQMLHRELVHSTGHGLCAECATVGSVAPSQHCLWQ